METISAGTLLLSHLTVVEVVIKY